MIESKDSHYTTLNAWVDQHSYSLQTILVDDAKSPEVGFRAREASQTHVNALADSFLSMQRVHQQSIFVSFFAEGTQLPDKRGFSLTPRSPMYAACSRDGFYFVAGDHTQLALKKIKADYPRNAMWSTVTGQLLICHRTAANIQKLKSWGILDNVKGDKRRAVSFEQKVLALHQDYIDLVKRLGVDDENFKSTLTSIKNMRRKDYNMNANSFGQLWGLASRTGPVWECLQQIITGKVENNKRFKPPKSASPFTNMANIPEPDLVTMLRKVVDGTQTLAQFRTQTFTYKARARVQEEILKYPDINMKSWTVAKAKFPNTCDAWVVNIWAQHILEVKLKMKSPMPSGFFDMISERLAMDQSLNKSNAILSQVNLVFCLHIDFVILLFCFSDECRLQGVQHLSQTQPGGCILFECADLRFQAGNTSPKLWCVFKFSISASLVCNITHMCSDIIYWDMPYGLSIADWDVLLTDSEAALFFQQLAIMNTASAHTIFLHVHPKDIGRIWHMMESNGYQHVHILHVYKPQHNTVGTHQYLNAIDQILVGYYPKRDAVKPRFENPNPLYRHNLIWSHTPHHKRKMEASGDMSPVNPTEKHPIVSMQLGKIHSKPGGRALVIGAGSGSEIIGFNRAGLNVTALEKDPRQFQAICSRLVEEKEKVEEINEIVTQELQQVAAQVKRTSRFQCDNKRVDKQSPQKHKTKKLKPSQGDSPVTESSATPRNILPKTCVACGEANDEQLGKCERLACSIAIHAKCMQSCSDCDALFCKSSCRKEHDCPSASEKVSSSEKPKAGNASTSRRSKTGAKNHEA